MCVCVCLCVANKEEVVQKARPVSSDVGSSNPNFSDLMDEFIQERLRANGTVVSSTHAHTHTKIEMSLSQIIEDTTLLSP